MDDYPDTWDSLRKQVYKRDEYKCRNCGLGGGPKGETTLVAHHIVPRSAGGNDSVSNLATICESCHSKIHSHLDKPTGSIDKESISTNSKSGSEQSGQQTQSPTQTKDDNEDRVDDADSTNSEDSVEDKTQKSAGISSEDNTSNDSTSPVEVVDKYDDEIKEKDRR